jgi:uncharacterized protein (TIGR02594 family)
MTRFNDAILEAAGEYLGLQEWPGAKHNPKIVQMFADSGHAWVQDDETPWCAAFVGSVLGSLGLPHTRSLAARSYADYGSPVEPQGAVPGDVVVLWRNSPQAATGHVGFFVRYEGDKVILRGGNQGNKVTDAGYPLSRIVAVRRPDGKVAGPTRPALRMGDTGAFVIDLQDQLERLRYFLGRVDGIFGHLTREAVLAFQADNELAVDGVVGPKTWDALAKADAKPVRDVTPEDLKGSRTIQSANTISTAAGATVGIAGMGTAIEAAQMLGEAEGALATAQRLVMDYWPVLLVIVAALVIWRYAERIKAVRLEDARMGRNLGR